jgi:hypothetical protein
VNRERLALTAACLAVAGGLAAGFATLGSPRETRLVALDGQRADDLALIAERLHARYGDAQALPERLPADLGALRSDGSDATRDPASGARYRYVREGARRYRVCATFATRTSAVRGNALEPHPAAAACYRGDVRRPALGERSAER